MPKSVNLLFQESFKKHWKRPALSNYQGATLNYSDLARRIAKIHILFEQCGLQRGDKVALCSRNQANWAVSFLAIMTYGAVPVPLLHEFKPGNIHYLVNHSDAKMLFVGSSILENLSGAEMPALDAIVRINDFAVIYAKDPSFEDFESRSQQLLDDKYPEGFGPNDVVYYQDRPNELALINYTSGTSGFSKGVMLSYKSVWSNIMFATEIVGVVNEYSNLVVMLPTAHMYGLMFEFLYEITKGVHLHFLTRAPSPKVILGALSQVKPDLVISVPLIIEKLYKNMLLPFISKRWVKTFINIPVLDQMIEKKILQNLVTAFGGEFKEVIIGGAAFNREAEAFFKRIKFPFTVGYGMTECGPIITYAHWSKQKLYSCGKVTPRMKIKIDSPDPKNIPGEVMVKGDNVFIGYYKNPSATKAAFDKGWFRTGDMGVIDSDGYLFLKGRCKNMILGPSGQNIYPEEIESGLNNLPYVGESLVIEDDGSLKALIYPDYSQVMEENLTNEELLEKLREGIKLENLELPNYCRIKDVEIFPEEFEKTPKKSIKRYLYQRSNDDKR